MKVIEKIIHATTKLVNFWSSCEGFPPNNTWCKLQKCNMQRHIELSESLLIWFEVERSDANLILAWTNLGALVEGILKLYLTTYYDKYKDDINKIIKRKKLQDPFDLNLEDLKVFFHKKEIFKNNISQNNWYDFISFIQEKRNTIHAFKDKEIGKFQEFEQHLNHYLLFIYFVDMHLPVPPPYPFVGRGLLYSMHPYDATNPRHPYYPDYIPITVNG